MDRGITFPRGAWFKRGTIRVRRGAGNNLPVARLSESGAERRPDSESRATNSCRSPKRRDRVKLLCWDVDGLVIVFKRLEAGPLHFPAAGAGERGCDVCVIALLTP